MDLPDQTDVLAQPTRARLFSTLQNLRRSASTEELAGELDLHRNGVRRQLHRLQEAGLVDRRRVVRGRGRPRDQWSIAPTASPTGSPPSGYADLARWLTESIARDSASPLAQLEKTGREIGRGLTPGGSDDVPGSMREIFSALGFQPEIEPSEPGTVSCTLGNCPYRDSVRRNPDLVCTLHKGITLGVLDILEPASRLTRFEPHDPDRAGCLVEVEHPAAEPGR